MGILLIFHIMSSSIHLLPSLLYNSRKTIRNVYMHLPFCRKKCHFCAFPIHAIGQANDHMDEYLIKLKKQIQFSKQFPNLDKNIETLYFGGGTPSLYSFDQIKSLIQLFPTNDQTQITVQVNPSQLNKLADFSNDKSSINRISLGLQTFNTSVLDKTNRHKSQSYNRKLIQEILKSTRPKNLSVDFILNFCMEEKDWKEVLAFIEEIRPQHITLYILQINQHSKMHSEPEAFKWLPEEDPVSDRYIEASEILSKLGYDHYQVSNFALKPEYKSKHSRTYWDGDRQYLAYGMGATSLLKGMRVTRPTSLTKYYKFVESLNSTDDFIPSELGLDIYNQNSKMKQIQTLLMSGLRVTQGIPMDKLQKLCGQQNSQTFQSKLILDLLDIAQDSQDLINWQVIDQRLALKAPYGFLVADAIAYRLIYRLQQQYIKDK